MLQPATVRRSEGARMSGDAIMTFPEIAKAIDLGARGATQKEIAQALGCTVEKVVRSLSVVGVRLDAKPFGMRPVTVRLSGPQVEGLRTVADKQGMRSATRHMDVAEQALRRLAADPDLLGKVLDPTLVPVFVPKDTLLDLEDEAKRRGQSTQELATMVVMIVGRDKMVPAVVDDAEEVEP